MIRSLSLSSVQLLSDIVQSLLCPGSDIHKKKNIVLASNLYNHIRKMYMRLYHLHFQLSYLIN